MKWLPARRSSDSGAVAVIVAVLMVVFIGFAALVVDMGYAYTVKRQLQAAADAAALAGCQELILAGPAQNGRILDVAREYAEIRNAVKPAEGLWMVDSVPDTEVGNNFVQVTVETTGTLFFGRLFADEFGTIRARARAQVAYATGVSRVVPFGMPLVRNPYVTATIGNGPETPLDRYDAASGEWYSTSVPVPGGASTTGKNVKVTVYNNQNRSSYPEWNLSPSHLDGVPMSLNDAASVVVRGTSTDNPPTANSALIATQLVGGYVGNRGGETGKFRARVAGAPGVKVQFGSPPMRSMTLAPDGWWEADFAVPSDDGSVKTYQVDLELGYGPATKYTLHNVARVVSRRSTYPITSVTVEPAVVQDPDPDSVEVRVKVFDYVFDQTGQTTYEVNLSSGANSWGSFQAIDLNELRHYTVHYKNGPTEYPSAGGGGANAYEEFLATGYPYVVHIGDAVQTKSAHGNMATPTTRGLNTRFGSDTRTFLQWIAAGKPATRRIVFIPMLENIEPESNNTPYRIVAFGAFYIEPRVTGQPSDEIRGHFIEYLAPSDDLEEEPPPGETYIMVPRLVVPSPPD